MNSNIAQHGEIMNSNIAQHGEIYISSIVKHDVNPVCWPNAIIQNNLMKQLFCTT